MTDDVEAAALEFCCDREPAAGEGLLDPVEGGIAHPVQQDAAILLRGDGRAGQLDPVVVRAEQGLHGGVQDQGQGRQLGGGEGAPAALGLIDGLPAPCLVEVAPQGLAQVGQLLRSARLHPLAERSLRQPLRGPHEVVERPTDGPDEAADHEQLASIRIALSGHE